MSSRRQFLSVVAASTLGGCLQLTEDTVTNELLSLQAPATTTPLIRNGTVYVGSTDHNLYAANVQSGQEVFTTDLGAEVGRGLIYENGLIYASNQNAIFGIDAETGDIIFHSQESATGFGINKPLIDKGRLYYSGSKLASLDSKSGDVYWTKDSFTWNKRPTIVNNILIVSDRWDATTTETKKSRIFGLNPDNGQTQWTTKIETDALLSSIASSPEHEIAVITGEEKLIAAFDTGSGEEIWRASIDEVNLLSPLPIINQETVFVPAGRHGVSAYNLLTGDLKWTSLQQDKIDARRSAKIVDERLIVVTTSRDGITEKVTIRELDLGTGESLKEYELNPQIEEYQLPAFTSDSIVYPTSKSTVLRVPRNE